MPKLRHNLVSMIANIAHYKKNVFVIAETNVRNNLTDQSILKVTRGIMLRICLTIALMKD